ncbi:hypothetical protein Trydic_g15033 [Trypoxylus dichotomus]
MFMPSDPAAAGRQPNATDSGQLWEFEEAIVGSPCLVLAMFGGVFYSNGRPPIINYASIGSTYCIALDGWRRLDGLRVTGDIFAGERMSIIDD